MQKILSFAPAAIIILLILISSPVLASKKELKNTNAVTVNSEVECDPENDWKNHGEYVSCVAKLKLGGRVVSEAAQSDIGKKDQEPNQSPNPSASPTAIPSASPTASPSASPSGSPSASPSASPTISPEPSPTGIGTTGQSLGTNALAGAEIEIKAFIGILQNLIKSLQNLIKL